MSDDDFMAALMRDPHVLDHVLAELCRSFREDGVPIPEFALPLLAERFLAYLAHVEAQAAKRKDKGKWGAHRAGRAIHRLVHVYEWPLKDARRVVAPQAGIDEESAEKDYRRFLQETEPPAESQLRKPDAPKHDLFAKADQVIRDAADDLAGFKRDPHVLDHILLATFCREFLEEGRPIPEFALPLLADRFRDYVAHVEAQEKRKGNKSKWGAHRAGRAIHLLVHVYGWQLKDARRVAAAQAGIDEESAEKDYRRFLQETEPRAEGVSDEGGQK